MFYDFLWLLFSLFLVIPVLKMQYILFLTRLHICFSVYIVARYNSNSLIFLYRKPVPLRNFGLSTSLNLIYNIIRLKYNWCYFQNKFLPTLLWIALLHVINRFSNLTWDIILCSLPLFFLSRISSTGSTKSRATN